MVTTADTAWYAKERYAGDRKMPYKSKAQQRFMHAAANRGEISQATVKEFDRSTNFSKLPERKRPSMRDAASRKHSRRY